MISFKEYVNEIKSRFSDNAEDTLETQEIYRDLIFDLCGKKLEFKSENEVKPDGDIYFTYEEALALQKDGWRLPTREEFQALTKREYMFGHSKGVFDSRLILPAAGYRSFATEDAKDAGSYGAYWSSTSTGWDNAWYLGFYSPRAGIYKTSYHYCYSVHLVREV